MVKHGETEETKKGILQRHIPVKLTKKGINQAKRLAKRLKDEEISAIYSSDLARSDDTAKEIIKFHPNADLYHTKELRESDSGIPSRKYFKNIYWNKHRNTEKKEAMLERAEKILKKAYSKYKDKTVVFVSHGNLIGILNSILMNKPLESYKGLRPEVHTAVTIFEIKEDNEYNLILLNCEKHLE